MLKNTKVLDSDGVELPDGQITKDREQNGYKYIGVLEADHFKEKTMKGTRV